MMKLSKTGIGLLTNQYKSVLRKCALINMGLLIISSPVLARDHKKGSYTSFRDYLDSTYEEMGTGQTYIEIYGNYAGYLSIYDMGADIASSISGLNYALDNNYYRKLKISSPHNALITCIYL